MPEGRSHQWPTRRRIRRTMASGLLAGLLSAAAPAFAQTGQDGLPRPDAQGGPITVERLREEDRTETYRRLIALALQMPPDFDFTALRMAFVRSPYYRPFDASIRARIDSALLQLRDATRGGVSWVEARDQLTELCRALLADISVQLACYGAAEHNLGQREVDRDRTFHRWVISGLTASIRSSGDGSSPETALQVISLEELRFTVQTAGFRLLKRSLVPADMSPPGRVIHMASVARDQSDDLRLFFDVSYPAAFAPAPPPGEVPADDGG